MASQPLKQESYLPQAIPVDKPATLPKKQRVPDRNAAVRTRDKVSVLGSLLLVTVFVLFIISRYATIMVNNYHIENMQSSIKEQASLNASIQAQVTELASPTRILAYAENVLKMVPATPVQVGANNH